MRETFSKLEDTGQLAQVRHDLYEIIATTIAAVIGNSDGWDKLYPRPRGLSLSARKGSFLYTNHPFQIKRVHNLGSTSIRKALGTIRSIS